MTNFFKHKYVAQQLREDLIVKIPLVYRMLLVLRV